MSLNMSVTRITLDIRNIENQLSFAVKQNDTARRIIISLTDGGKPYTIERGCYAVFSGETSGHQYISEGCQITGNEIIYDFTPATAATVGCVECDITLFGSTGEVIASPCFTMNVYESKMSEYADEVLASDDFNTLQMLITDAVAATESAAEATESAVEAVKNIEQTLDNGRQQGLIPFIGSNGNWWIGTTDTGVSAGGSSGGGSQPTYLQVSDAMSFDWYRAIADALGSGEYLPYDNINSGELLLSFDDFTCYAPDNSGKSIKKTKVYFTIEYVGQGTHSLTLSINYKGKLYITESYSELQTDSTYKFIFSRPYLSFYLPTT